MLIPFEWQMIDKKERGYTQRAKVIGGWLVRTYDLNIDPEETESMVCTSMIFISDINHEWKIK